MAYICQERCIHTFFNKTVDRDRRKFSRQPCDSIYLVGRTCSKFCVRLDIRFCKCQSGLRATLFKQSTKQLLTNLVTDSQQNCSMSRKSEKNLLRFTLYIHRPTNRILHVCKNLVPISQQLLHSFALVEKAVQRDFSPTRGKSSRDFFLHTFRVYTLTSKTLFEFIL